MIQQRISGFLGFITGFEHKNRSGRGSGDSGGCIVS
jgi:hypothetical protein